MTNRIVGWQALQRRLADTRAVTTRHPSVARTSQPYGRFASDPECWLKRTRNGVLRMRQAARSEA